ncbi:MAG: ATP-binding protein [bacterium]
MSWLPQISQSALPGEDLLSKIKWLVAIRVIVITLLLGSMTILQFRNPTVSLLPFSTLIIITYVMTILYAIILRLGPPDVVFFAYIQICGDLIIETALVFYTGGIRSPFSFAYSLTIITTSILLSRRSSMVVASFSSLVYGLLLALQFTGILIPPYNYVPKEIELNLLYVSHTIFANIFAFYLTAFLSGYLAELQRRAGRELQARDGDIAQLQTFNENILQSMSSGLIVSDLTGWVALMNRAAIRILDLPRPASGKGAGQFHWNQLFRPLQIEKYYQSMDKGGKNFLRLESRIKRKGQETFLGLTISILRNPQGEAKGLITNFQDLTEYKKMEEQVKQAEVLATIGQMSASIAHELRNPMASIRGSVQFLHDELELDEENRHLMEIILKESNRLNRIITDFLLYARPQPPNPQNCSLADIVQETVTLIQKSGEKNDRIQIVTDIAASMADVEADPGQIKQVFWNLATNACQAMPDGGTFTIRVREAEQGFCLIEFADTGIGISPEGIKQLFTPFYTTKDRGMGLGLSIAYRIVEEHHGKIEVISAPGEGSNFRVFLPAASPILLEDVRI